MNCKQYLLTVITLALLAPMRMWAVDYYVAPNGDDDNAGTFEAPYATIQKAADIMVAGDRCLIRRGTYRETVLPQNSGTAGAPIVYMPYNNERVVIAGTEVLTGWTKAEGNIYKAPMSWDLGKGNNQLFVNGDMVVEARHPNLGTKVYSSNEDLTPDQKGYNSQWYIRDHVAELGFYGTVYCPVMHAVRFDQNAHTLTFQTPDRGSQKNIPHKVFDKPKNFFKGGLYWGQHHAWYAQSAEISGSEGNVLSVVDTHWIGRMLYGFRSGGVISGVYGLLDTAGEWFYNSDENMMYLWAPDNTDPNTLVVEAKKRNHGMIVAGKDYITIKGLYFFGTTISIDQTDHTVIDGIHAKYVSHYTHIATDGKYNIPSKRGIHLRGHNLVFKNSSIQYSASSGIYMERYDWDLEDNGHKPGVYPRANLIENNLIRYIDYYATYAAGINVCMEEGGQILRNTVSHTGRSSMNVNCGGGYHNDDLYALTVKYNKFHDAMMISGDGGLFYTYGVSNRGSEFAYNWMYNNHNKEGALLYLDLGGWEWEIHHNVFWIKDGANYRCIGPTQNRNIIYNNTLVNFGWGGYEREPKGNNNLYVNLDTVPVEIADPVAAGILGPEASALVDPENFDFSLQATSAAIDKATMTSFTFAPYADTAKADFVAKVMDYPTVIDPSEYTGAAPDLGAYEYGLPKWTAGHDWGEPNWEYPLRDQSISIRSMLAQISPVKKLTVTPKGISIIGKQWNLSVFDMQGRQVLAAHAKSNIKKTFVPMDHLSTGLFIVRLNDGVRSRTVSVSRVR